MRTQHEQGPEPPRKACRKQAEDIGWGHKGQSHPERPAGHKLRTQAEDTAQIRARETQKGPQDTN